MLQGDVLNSSLNKKELNRMVVSPEKYIVNRLVPRAPNTAKYERKKVDFFTGERVSAVAVTLRKCGFSVPSWGVNFGGLSCRTV